MKIKTTGKYVLFNGGKMGNWHGCKFSMDIDGKEVVFHSSEQAFMFFKAREFGDKDAMEKIASLKPSRFAPGQAKRIGRQVKGFDGKHWADVRQEVMYNVVLAKFSQNYYLAEFMLSSDFRGKSFVEAFAKDRIWGIGLDVDDKDAEDENKWRGLNLLGKVLDRVRAELLKQRYANTTTTISHDDMELRKQEEWLKAAQEKLENEGRMNLIDIRKMNDSQVVTALLDRDDSITADFFFVKCRPLILDIIGYVFKGKHVSYDEVVAEIYYYLMRPSKDGRDAAVLRSFAFRSSLYNWMKFVLISFLLRHKRRILERDERMEQLPDEEAFNGLDEAVSAIGDGDTNADADNPWAVIDMGIRRQEAADRIEAIFQKMTGGKQGRALQGARNYVNVLKMKYLDELDDKEAAQKMNIKTDNFYMLKGRAVRAFRAAAMEKKGIPL